MSEFSVDPSTLEWLASQSGARVIGIDRLGDLERAAGEIRAQRIIDAWAKTDDERAFLDALASGHEIAEARRISGLSRGRADGLLRRIRGDSAGSHKQT